MKRKLAALLLVMLPFVAILPSAYANPQSLGTCFIDSLTGKERKLLAQWMFLSIASHPDLTPFSNIKKVDTDATDKSVGQLITRLFVDDCPAEAKAAQKADPMAINKAFEMVGQVAMQEILSNNDVKKAISNYVIYTDQNKINALFAE